MLIFNLNFFSFLGLQYFFFLFHFSFSFLLQFIFQFLLFLFFSQFAPEFFKSGLHVSLLSALLNRLLFFNFFFFLSFTFRISFFLNHDFLPLFGNGNYIVYVFLLLFCEHVLFAHEQLFPQLFNFILLTVLHLIRF